MNRRVLVCLIAMALIAAVGCRPRHPPHTPQPFGVKDANGSPIFANERGTVFH